MRIELNNLGKRFNQQWIFRHLNYQFNSGQAYAIVGPNGSGKSTLLQVIAGSTEKSEGQLTWTNKQKPVEAEDHFKQISIAAPYLELIEELTLTEFLDFHQSFKSFLPGWNTGNIIRYISLEHSAHKQIRLFSSGMKQRVKLAQAVFSQSNLVMLDEPSSNLDLDGIALYRKMVEELCSGRLLIICSNEESEIDFCTHRLNVMDFKPIPVA
jgi:ABC-type multidrug transport system ATPase subunit